ncbi:MAG: OadG family protein [Ruminococcus sp.]|nr:OadG family protein [Ruminococcus sp.]
MNIGDAPITAVYGYAVVFAGLLMLMVVIYCMGAFFKSRAVDKTSAVPTVPEVKSEPVPEAEKKTAPGSAGRIKLYDVPDKEAAMIMAIVADTMKKPINELHFISIKEVK